MHDGSDAESLPGLSFRRPGAGPSFPAPSPRGIPVDYGSKVDDRRYGVPLPSRQQQPLLFLNGSVGHDEEETLPSRHLWVGNVSQEVTEGLLVEKFIAFGSLESVTVYSQRNYAFINFRDIDNARDAKNRLQGIILGGLALRIEFARGAKPSRHLWVGGICKTVSREVIEGEFKRFGIMEEFKFLRDRNCAFVDYEKMEDAISAVDSLNRKRLGDEELRVDFGRSQPPKRDTGGRPSSAPRAHEEWGFHHHKGHRDHADQLRILAESNRLPDARQLDRGSYSDSFAGPSEDYQAGSGPGSVAVAQGKTKGEKEEPSDVLWVGFPLLSKVDEEGLRKAFVPYGEVERVKTFPGRTYAFVQFKKVEEASRAKVALEGKLFNDPRVHIRFSNSEIGPVDTPKTHGSFFCMSQGKDALEFTEKGTGRVAGSDWIGSTIPLRSAGLRPEYFPGGLARGAASPIAARAGSVISFGRGLGLRPSDTEIRFPVDLRDYQIESQGGRGFPAPGERLCDKQLDFRDKDTVGREVKRARTVHGEDVDPLFTSIDQGGRLYSTAQNFDLGLGSDRDNHQLPLTRITGNADEYSQVMGLPRVRGSTLQFDRPRNVAGVQGQSAEVLADGSPFDLTVAGKRENLSSDGVGTGVNEGWRWHGTIAKGGTPVCRARCLPVGKGINVTVPDVVNCTARTDLDMLAKHVYQAGDFGVVFFVPEADPDVPPYHDFMHYLGEKHRAGVAKLVNGTTLFLVPPSEFSERVLKVPGKNCLFGVVLKAQQSSPVEHAYFQQLQPYTQLPQQQHLPQQLYHQPVVTHQQAVSHQQQRSRLQGMVLLNGHSIGENGTLPPPVQNLSSPSPTSETSTLKQSPLTSLTGCIPTVLTPELIASLTALLPSQNQPAPSSAPQVSGSKTQLPPPREGVGVGGILGRIVPNSGSAASSPATTNNRSAYRPPISHQQPVQSLTWHSGRSDQQVGISRQISVPPDQGSGYVPPKQQQSSQQQPQASPSVVTAHSHSGPSPGLIQHDYPGLQSQIFQGYYGQLVKQHPGPLQKSLRSGGAPLLPTEQLTQLTALLTQRQQQPAQQQQVAQLLQQHYQQQQVPFSPVPQQQPVLLSSHQRQAYPYVQQPEYQQQLHAQQMSSQQQWAEEVPLPQHVSQSLEHLHMLGGGWDVLPGTEGQQHQQLSPSIMPQPPVSLPQEQQLLPIGGLTADEIAGANQDDTERQKRFQATLRLAAALLQQMQHQQSTGQGNFEQRMGIIEPMFELPSR